ncbi:MAG: hypothetical protein AAGC46_17200, partial [Solirubrobacteraceae bacterium]
MSGDTVDAPGARLDDLRGWFDAVVESTEALKRVAGPFARTPDDAAAATAAIDAGRALVDATAAGQPYAGENAEVDELLAAGAELAAALDGLALLAAGEP